MLGGTIVFKDPQRGNITYNVLGRDSFNDLKMQFTAISDFGTEEWTKALDLFDLDEDGRVTENDTYRCSDKRRLDVKKTNKYKSNMCNRDMCSKISALIRYMQIAGKQFYNQQVVAEFSPYHNVDIVEPISQKQLGTIHYKMGLITQLICENKYVKIYLDEISDEHITESIFMELKEKDKFGRVLSVTPISIVGFKLQEDVLGFQYIPEVAKEEVQAFGMYETIEDVIANNPNKNTAWILKQDYHIVTDETLESVMQMFYDWDDLIAFDTETSGLKINFKSRTNEADQLVGVVLSRKAGEGYYFPLQHKLFANLCKGDHFYFMDKYMRPLLENKRIICHNLKFDWKVAYIYDINANVVYDTMLAFGITKQYEESSYEIGLKSLTKNILGRDSFELSDFIMGGSFGDSEIAFWDLPYELVRQYAPADTDNTYALYDFLEREQILNNYNAKRVFEIEITFAKAVAYSEFYGYHIDVEKIPELQSRILGAMSDCQKEMFKIAGEEFNANSPQQLCTIMYDKLGVETVGDKRSTDKDTLKILMQKEDIDGNVKYPFVKDLKEYRDNEGIYKNFLKKLPFFSSTDGYIFPDVLQIGTTTGRVSVKNPNYQSYNDIVKHYVCPRPGFYHFDSDFAQIEQRVLTSYACIMYPDAEPLALLKDFDDPDMDYHTYQAARMFNVPYAAVSKGMRQQSKGINFGLPYGMGDESLGARIFGERTSENTLKAATLRKKFFQGQELIAQFFEQVRNNGVKNGFTETQWGRRRYYHRGLFSVSQIRRQAGNHVIQGCVNFDTLIQTQEYGIVKISDVVDLHLNVWNGEKWTPGDILYSGKKKKCIVHFMGGQDFICSPEHKFLVVSHRGNKRFVECKDLIGKDSNKNSAYRVAMTREYEPSGNLYSSEFAYNCVSTENNANNVFLENIGDSYNIGLVLGRLVLDGTVYLQNNTGNVTQIVSEHEYSILPELRDCMKNLNFTEKTEHSVEGNIKTLTSLDIDSKSLASEINALDVKHQVHKNIFMDTEVLRGFLCGLFDGDGGVCVTGKHKYINLVFGTQYDFEPMCKDIQKALLFFGVRSYYKKFNDRHVINIRKQDVPRFLEMIGFMNKEKVKKANTISYNTDDHIFGSCLMVESVEMTDEFVDMYDVCNTDGGYYVADGIITHNTAADIYKKAVNNMFERICKEGWLGKVLINGFIHDEMLIEVSDSINPYYFFKAWREEFEVKPEKYCRLYAGAGIGHCWYDAKKLDLPPLFIQEIIDTYTEDMPWDGNFDKFLAEIKVKYNEHKIKRIREYIQDEQNQNVIIKPAIGSLLGDEIETIVATVLADSSLYAKYNEALGEKVFVENTKSIKIKKLQQQLKLFCSYYDIDYTGVHILSPDDAPVSSEISVSAEMNEDVDIDLGIGKEELLFLGLITNGIIIDHETQTIHMAELWLRNKKGNVQGTKTFIAKSLIVSDADSKGYKIIYYPNLTEEHPKGTEIKGFCVPFDNAPVLIQYYTDMLAKKFACIIK